MRIAVEGVRADLWCRTCESVVPGRSRSTTARDLPANDCSRVSSGVDSEVESRPASADFESLTFTLAESNSRKPVTTITRRQKTQKPLKLKTIQTKKTRSSVGAAQDEDTETGNPGLNAKLKLCPPAGPPTPPTGAVGRKEIF